MDAHEENAIGESRQGIHLAIAIGKPGIGRPFAHDCCTQSDHQRKAVKEHMDAVTEEAEGASQEPIR